MKFLTFHSSAICEDGLSGVTDSNFHHTSCQPINLSPDQSRSTMFDFTPPDPRSTSPLPSSPAFGSTAGGLLRSLLGAGLLILALTACQGDGPGGTNTGGTNTGGTNTGGTTPSTAVIGPGTGWSDPVTWGGRVPDPGTNVVIPKGKTVVLDGNASVKNLEIAGTLSFADSKDIELRAESVMVMGGEFRIGSEGAPFTHRATLTLSGNPSDQNTNTMGCGAKFLCTMGGGRLELHGQRRDAVSWTKLAQTLEAGATQMNLLEPVRWQPGDEVVLAPTGYDNGQHERVTVGAVSADGKLVAFTPAAKYQHWGQLQTYAGQSVDERGEVALLSRNIVIRSAPETIERYRTTGRQATLNSEFERNADPKRRFGGHVMVMDGQAHVEGVEFRDLGQETRLGRYAFHWHQTGESKGQYIKNSSITDSFTRGIVVHGTNNTLVEGNVVYNSVSHNIIFSEAGNENGNQFVRNFALGTYQFPDKHHIVVRASNGDPNSDAFRTQDEHRPSGYWGLNHNNRLVGNVAAGGEGEGFFFAGVVQGDLGQFEFKGNVAHSYFSQPGGNDLYPPDSRGHCLFVGPGEGVLTFRDFTAYKCMMSGAWLESPDTTLTNAVLADNNAGVLAFQGKLEHSLVLGRSANTNGQPTPFGSGIQGGIHLGPVDQGGDHIAKVSTEKVTLVNTQALNLRGPITEGASGGIVDRDGSLTGTGKATLVLGSRSLQADASCELRSTWKAYLCPIAHQSRLLNLMIADAFFPGSPITRREYWNIHAVRDDGVKGAMYIEGLAGGRPAVLLGQHRYDLDFSELSNASANPNSKARLLSINNPSAGLSIDPTQWITLSFAVPGEQVWVYPMQRQNVGTERNVKMPKTDAPLAAVGNIDTLNAASQNAWFFDAATKKVSVKLWGASELYVCETQTCQ
jgi:G8 domain